MRLTRSRAGLALLTATVLVAGCNAKSGRVSTLQNPNWQSMEPMQTHGTWEVFGEAKRAEFRPAGEAGYFHERVILTNGYISHGTTTNDNQLFYETTERTHREMRDNTGFLNSDFKSAKIDHPGNPGRPAFYSVVRWDGGNSYCTYFTLNFGNSFPGAVFDGATAGWQESVHGRLCGPSGISEADFRQQFLKRLAAFGFRDNKGQRQDHGFKPWRPGTGTTSSSAPKIDFTKLDNQELCRMATDNRRKTWDKEPWTKEHVDEAKRRSLSADDCLRLRQSADTLPKTTESRRTAHHIKR